MKSNRNISLHEPSFNGNEIKYIEECINSTWVSTSGKFIDKFEIAVKKYLNSKHAIACISGTASLHISLLVADVKKGDEVIVPTITFIAPINAVKYVGADPIFMDVDNFYNIDQNKTIEFITKHTIFKNGYTINKKNKSTIKAIILVHTFGNPCSIDNLRSLCKKRNIKIIEDASESLGSKYTAGNLKNKFTGTIGDIGCISFNGNKIITSGSGGMIMTNSSKLAKKARYLIKQAKDDNLNYIHNSIGYNYGMTNIHAAIGLAQFENIKKILKFKKILYKSYLEKTKSIDGINIVMTPNYATSNHWLNIIQVDKKLFGKDKNSIIKDFAKKNIFVRPVWHPNHLQKMYKKNQCFKIKNANILHNNSICLPSSYNLRKSDLKDIINVLNG
jgi:perosamine synthetase